MKFTYVLHHSTKNCTKDCKQFDPKYNSGKDCKEVEVLFEFVADETMSLTDVDKLFQAETGIDVLKNMMVGVKVSTSDAVH
jgi:hypothetical protein